MAFGLDTGAESVVSIKVIGVGGGGSNVVNRMVESGVKGVETLSLLARLMTFFSSGVTSLDMCTSIESLR